MIFIVYCLWWYQVKGSKYVLCYTYSASPSVRHGPTAAGSRWPRYCSVLVWIWMGYTSTCTGADSAEIVSIGRYLLGTAHRYIPIGDSEVRGPECLWQMKWSESLVYQLQYLDIYMNHYFMLHKRLWSIWIYFGERNCVGSEDSTCRNQYPPPAVTKAMDILDMKYHWNITDGLLTTIRK